VRMSHQDCHLHPSFKSKPVYELRCLICDALMCARGMKAILLADRSVELYSTDMPPPSAVQLIGRDYQTNNCHCRIKDVACSICGSVVGYHVILPCRSCLSSCNNGHFWMYHSNAVDSRERLDTSGGEVLVWSKVPLCSEDETMRSSEDGVRWVKCCR